MKMNQKSTEGHSVRLQVHQHNPAMQNMVCEVPSIRANLTLINAYLIKVRASKCDLTNRVFFVSL